MISLIQNLIRPKGTVFYTCFQEATANINKMATLLVEMAKTTSYEVRVQKAAEIEMIEHANDDLTHRVFTQLHGIFLTPISREDICDLAGKLDDVCDFIFATSRSILPLKMEKTGSDTLLFAQCLGRMCAALTHMFHGLESNNIQKTQKYVRALRKMEHEADDLYEYAMRNLFLEESDFKDFIRSREVFIHMEELADKCETLANTVDNVSWKRAAG